MADQKVKEPKSKKIREHKILFKPVIGPILGSIGIYVLSEFVIGLILANLFIAIIGASPDDLDKYLGWFSAVGGIVCIFLHKAWFQGKFKGCYSGKWGDKKTIIMIIIVVAANLILLTVAYISAGMQAPTFATFGNALMPGLCEEAAFRLAPISLAMHKAKDKKNIYTALIISSVLFGLVHFSNVAIGQSLSGTIIQVIATFGMGVFFGAVYLKTGNLLITIIYHTVYDFLGMLQAMASGLTVDLGQASFVSSIPQLVVTVVYIVVGILLIRGSENDILDVWKERWTD